MFLHLLIVAYACGLLLGCLSLIERVGLYLLKRWLNSPPKRARIVR
jgi:uncharacterized membrane protein (DUF2068 family)